jgi:hypothetical protein
MPEIRARVGSQNVVRVLSNASSPPSNLIDLRDVNSDFKTEDGMILVWDLPSQKFIMTSVIDSSSSTISGIAYYTNTTDNVLGDPNSGAVQIDGGVGINKNLTVGSGLNVFGLSTFSSNVDINASIDVDGHTELDNLNVSGVSTFASNVDINASVDIQNDLNVSGVSTFASDLDINASIDVDGHTELDDLNVSGVSTFASNVDINASVDISNDVVVGGGLTVNGTSEFIGSAIFRGGTIGIGDSVSDDINVSGEFISNLVPNTDNTYDLGITSQRWRNGLFSGLVTTTNLYVSGISTFANNLDISGDLNIVGFVSVTEGLYYDNEYDGPNGIAFFDNNGKLTGAASTESAIDTSNYILTTLETAGIGTPVWTSTIDGGEY